MDTENMKFRVTTTLQWEIKHDDPKKYVNDYLKDIPISSEMDNFKSFVHYTKIREKIEKVRLGEFNIDDIFPYVTEEELKREYLGSDGKTYFVKMNSSRYLLFKKSLVCVACGLSANKIFLEYHPSDQNPHFNFYGEEDGKLILMTKDHIQPKSLGGLNELSNYQTMCITCNSLKNNCFLTPQAINELRQLFNNNKKLPKKQLNTLITKSRNKLTSKKITSETLITTCHINVYKGKEIYGLSIEHPKNEEVIYCILKGIYLEPLAATKSEVLCHFIDNVVLPLSLVKKAK